jgi:hypothetical protein
MTDHNAGTEDGSEDGSDHRGGDQQTVAQVKAELLEWSRTHDIRTNKAMAQAGWYAAGGVGVVALVWVASRFVRGSAVPVLPAAGPTVRPSLLQSAARQAGRMSLLWRLGGWVFSRHQEQQGAARAAGLHAASGPRTPQPASPPALRPRTLPSAQGRIS